MPPTGGFGLNTGVQDVQNLAWKLAAVLHGQANASLLDTYHAERQPLGVAITEASLANSLSMGRTARQPDASAAAARVPQRAGADLRRLVRVVGGDPGRHAAPAARRPGHPVRALRAPGRRAPHAWLERDGARLSTIDLFGPRFVLLAGRRGDAWRAAAQRARRAVLPAPRRPHDRRRRPAHRSRRHLAGRVRDRRRGRRARPPRRACRLAQPRGIRRSGARAQAAMDGVLGRAAQPAATHLAER